MFIVFDQERPSDSPFVERVWSCHSEHHGVFQSVASPLSEIVFTRLHGRVMVTLRGPETRPRAVECPGDGEWLAIRLRAGSFLRGFPAHLLLDGNDVHLPQAGRNAFWLHGSRWQLPDFDNADEFVAKLASRGILTRDNLVAAALDGDPELLSQRSVQRRFQSACGMSWTALRQIERARHAARLLAGGASIIDAQFEAGYYDQAHLTRSLQRYVGLAPRAIARRERQLSFLYKKDGATLF